jgi:prolyl 4-hydroxylase
MSCSPSKYTVHICSKEPLVIYIEDFVSSDERNRLLEKGNSTLKSSTSQNTSIAHA